MYFERKTSPRIYIILFLFILNVHPCFGGEIDSLWIRVKDASISDSLRFAAANQLYNIYLNINYDSAFVAASTQHQIAKYAKNLDWEGKALLNLGALQTVLGKSTESLTYGKKALEIFTESGNQAGIAISHQILGTSYLDQGDRVTALDHYRTSRQLFEEIGDSLRLANTMLSIGRLFFYQKDSALAIKNFQESNRIYQKLNNQERVIATMAGEGAVYIAFEDYERGREIYSKCIKLIEQYGDKKYLSTIYNNLGASYEFEENYLEAHKYYLKSMALSDMLGNRTLKATTMIRVGNNFRKMGKMDSSIFYCTNGLNIAQESHDLEWEKDALFCLYETHQILENYDLALKAFEKHVLLRDSLNNIEKAREMTKKEMLYDFERSELANSIQFQKRILRRERILYLSLLIIFIGLLAFIYFRRQQRRKNKAQKLELKREQERQRQLEELDAMKSRFFANISHEFRTPLTLILGETEQLKEKLFNQALLPKLKTIENNGYRLLNLVNQILDLARLEAGKLRLQRQQIELIPYLKNLLFAFESLAEPRQQTLRFTSDIKEISSAIDPEKVERIMMNLLANALKFSPDEATIEMLVHTQDDQLQIGVRDQGPGVPPEDRERIFNRFYQNNAGEREGGTGIGLSLARELARLHEGDLTVESTPGRGSTFWLTLPLIHADAQPSSYRHKNNPIAEPQSGKTTAPTSVDQNAKEILIVEDNPEVRAFIGNLLSEKGYKVVEAIDGQDGLEKARASLPDLILSDVMMPKMDGYAFAKAIRSDERTSHIPLILLTAKASDESKITGLETGVDAYMIKPFNARELEVRIGQLISQRAELRKRFSTATIIRPSEVSAVPMDQAFFKKVTDAIEANMGNERFGVEELASEAGMSTPTLNRKLKALIDQPAGKLIISMRMQRAANLIRKNAGTIGEIGHQVGYPDPAHFSRAFKKQFGVSPSEFAEK